jgi:hypothetical protein
MREEERARGEWGFDDWNVDLTTDLVTRRIESAGRPERVIDPD